MMGEIASPLDGASAMPFPDLLDRPPQPVRRSRFRKWLRLGLVLVTLMVGGYCVLLYLAHRDLHAVFAELDRTDPGWRLDDVEAARKVIPPQENSTTQALAAAALMPPLWGGAEEFYGLFEDLPPEVRLNEQQLMALRTELVKASKAVAQARKLKDMPRGRHPIAYSKDYISTLLPGRQQVRELAALLRYDALLLAEENNGDAALDSCRALLNAGRSLDDEPLFISQLIRMVIRGLAVAEVERTLAQTEPAPAALQELQRLLEREEAAPVMQMVTRGERAGYDRLMEAVQAGDVSYSNLLSNLRLVSGIIGASPIKDVSAVELMAQYSPGAIALQRAALLQYMTEMVEAAKLPAHEQRTRLRELAESRTKRPVLVRLLAPSMEKVGLNSSRTQALLRCALVAVAAERYRREHGRWPASGAALVTAGLLKEMAADPFTGQPLRWRRLDSGLLIYSVGQDGKDDGGKLNRANPQAEGTDVGFQLWDVAKRRQPPRPPAKEPVARKRGD
jgi:hypothetical protein